MSRITLVEPEQLPESLRGLYDGDDPNWSTSRTAQAFGHHPDILASYLQWYMPWHTSAAPSARIELRLKELVRLRIGELNGCVTCQTARMSGGAVQEDEIAGGIQPAKLTPRERIAIEYAEAMALHHQRIDDVLVGELRGHFDEAELLELSMMIGTYIGFGRVLATLQLENTTCSVVPSTA